MIRAGSGCSSGQDAPGAWSAAADGVVVELDSGYADWGEARPQVSGRGGHDVPRPATPTAPLPFDEPRPVTVGPRWRAWSTSTTHPDGSSSSGRARGPG
ncbi:hypothetical protein [Streptomyces canus]|uniref:hypothetical protein n=1 Tax=Streptomyces canus TaxID=58343 RepID=UPI0036E345DB